MSDNQRLGGRRARILRLKHRSGIYPSASFEFLNLIKSQYKESSQIDKNPLGINNIPLLTLPILLSCLRILALEIESHKENLSKDGYESGLLEILRARRGNDIMQILEYYGAQDELKTSMDYLIEIRHEILHPAPFPEQGDPLPSYLKILEAEGLLWSPPSSEFACNLYDHFRSHRLFDWSFNLLIEASKCVIESDPYPEHFKELYRRNFYSKN
jgi:hypothetical protein